MRKMRKREGEGPAEGADSAPPDQAQFFPPLLSFLHCLPGVTEEHWARTVCEWKVYHLLV